MFKIIGTYKGKTEVLDTAKTLREANYLASEYRMAFGSQWVITIKN